jgi:hypothetical protein
MFGKLSIGKSSDRRSRRALRYAPHFEKLETRCCLACDLFVSGNTLQIVGDDLDNTVTITDDGAGNVAAVCTSPTGDDAAALSGIEKIVLSARSGNDSVSYTLTGDRVRKMELDFDLGAGSDFTTLHLADLVDPSAVTAIAEDFQINIRQGAGEDFLLAGNFAGGVGRIAVEADAKLEVKVDGGQDNDQALLGFQGARIDGELEIDLRGGEGEGADFSFLAAPLASVGPAGKLEWKVDDGAGPDAVNLDLGGTVVENDVVIDIKQGDGEDVVNAFGNGTAVGDNGKLELKLDAGSGNDIASIVFQQAVVNGELRIEVKQGQGDDAAFLFAQEALLGPGGLLEVKWDGGAGLDQGHAHVGATAGSTGTLKAELQGGDDDDNLTLDVVAPESVDLNALLDGGNGLDTCSATPNVEVKNCEA